MVVQQSQRIKKKITSPWGTYVYVRMSFGLMNVGAIFQREMEVSFSGNINDFIAFYQVDVTIFSKKRSDHLIHIEKMMIRCREYRISLNPKKFNFRVQKEKLLRHIVSK